MVTSTTDARSPLEERYGSPSKTRRRMTIASSVVLAVSGLGWLIWTIFVNSTPAVVSNIETYQIVDDHTANAVLDVRLKNKDVKATCRLVAYAADHSPVGDLTFIADPSQEQQPQTVRTERRATSVEDSGCTAAGQKHPR